MNILNKYMHLKTICNVLYGVLVSPNEDDDVPAAFDIRDRLR